MMNKKSLLCTTIFLALSQGAFAEAFRISDIKVEGLQRVSQGTVYSYLGLKPGDMFDPEQDKAPLQRLFGAHLFSDIKFFRDGDNLIVQVQELPVISSVSIEGNKDIKTDAIKKVFNEAGLSAGQLYNPSLINKLVQSLVQQYQMRSKYNTQIDPKIISLPNNRVKVNIQINEGDASKIEKIDIVGNKFYSDSELRKQFQTTTPTLTSFITKTDLYNPERVQADLQSLENFYFNRGFINFKVLNSNMAVSPDKKSLFWTITVDEGVPYQLAGYSFSGNTILSAKELNKLVTFKLNRPYDRSEITQTLQAMKAALGDKGYALADIKVVPDVNPLTKEVRLNFVFVPGERMYVHQINFTGNDKTYDRVLRRELRQNEGSLFSSTNIALSEARLRRLPMVGELKQQITTVPNEPNQIDITYHVKEQNTSYIQGGVGYGRGSGFMFNLKYGDNNFFGTGNQLNIAFGKSAATETYDFNFIDPYLTKDGISADYSLSYSKYNFDKQELSNWAADTKSAMVTLGYPISEYNKIFFGGGYRGLNIQLGKNVANEIKQYIDKNGHKFNEFLLKTSWARDTLDTAILPSSGSLTRINAEATTPGSTATYYKLNLNHQTYVPIGENLFAIGIHGGIGLGDGYGKTSGLPFYRNYYSGGIGTVRGYQYGSLGPNYANGDSAGGSMQINGGLQFYLPRGFGDPTASYRLSAFVDGGSAFANAKSFNKKALRYSAGIALEWVSPIGLLNLSYAWPLNKQKDDKVEAFQFTVGSTF